MTKPHKKYIKRSNVLRLDSLLYIILKYLLKLASQMVGLEASGHRNRKNIKEF